MSTPNNRKNKNGNRKDNENQPKFNSILPIAVLAIMFVLLFNVLITTYQKSRLVEVHYNEFKQMLENNEIAEAEIQSDRILLTTKEEQESRRTSGLYTTPVFSATTSCCPCWMNTVWNITVRS